MPITSSIIEDGRVVVQVVTDPWTGDDLIRAGEFERKYLDSVSHTVHVLVDFSRSYRLPRDLLRVQREPSTKHPRLGYLVFFGTRGWLRVLMRITLRFMRFRRYQFFKSEADAWIFLRQQSRENRPSADGAKPSPGRR